MPPRKTAVQDGIILKTEQVDIGSLSMYHRNPRIGNVDLIADSLKVNKQFKPIVVNVGTKTGRPNEILAGNHTWLGARRLGWKTLKASFIDVDDDAARKIVLADNKTSDLADYDDAILVKIIQELPDATGTGYTDDEVSKILAWAQEQTNETLADIEVTMDTQAKEQAEQERAASFDGAPLGEEDNFDPDAKPEAQPTLESASEDMPGMFQFKPPESLVFEGIGQWGIPKLRHDMLMTFDQVPKNLDSWAGSATKNWPDPDQWWLYNYGVDSTSGMKDISKVILSFYCFDDYFNNWFFYPERYVAKVLNSKIKYLITPNWSQSTDLPLVESLYALYKSRWVGRYCQEAGLTVCPDVNWRDGDIDWLEKYVIATLPKNLPLMALQLQTIDPDRVTGGIDHFKKQISMVFNTLKPQAALIYSGTQGRALVDELAPKSMPYRVIGTRFEKLSVQAKQRSRKTTL